MSREGLRTPIRAIPGAAGLMLLAAVPLHAYVGPGAGFAFLSSFLVLAGAILLALFSLLAWPFRMIYWAIRGKRSGSKRSIDRLVIVGLDGLDPVLAEKYMNEGKMPNLARMRAMGGFTRLKTTTPSISPVAWSSFMTGTQPSKHNIYDFLSRDPRNYLPLLSSARIDRPRKVLPFGKYRVPLSKPQITGLRKSVPFWKILGDHGIFSTILRVPITFPPERFRGHILSGMCTPDLKGSQGTFSFYSSRPEAGQSLEGGCTIPVEIINGRIKSHVSGPENTLLKKSSEMRIPLEITILGEQESARLDVNDQKFLLKKGEISPWIRLTFRPGLGVKICCICRFLISSITPHFEMYLTPLNMDPEKPALPISHPFYYSIYLSKLLGRFVTLGLANDTWALNEGVISERAFLDLAYAYHDEWERIFFNALSKTRVGVVACVFETTDSIQHMFFRYLDPGHPALKAGNCTMGANVIEDLYARMDGMIGRTQAKLDSNSVLLVMSDHGFKSFRRGVNLNAWLMNNGYLVLKDGATESGNWLCNADWTRTRAYALGLGGIYLNLKGREAHGIVTGGVEARALKKEIAEKLSRLEDSEIGTRAIRNVFDRDDIFNGPYKDNAPDLVIGYSEGFRASWDSVKGKAAGEVFGDNRKAWSGDHCIDPETVPGVLFSSRKLTKDSPAIWDIAPTALSLFGIPVPGYMDGRVLIENGTEQSGRGNGG